MSVAIFAKVWKYLLRDRFVTAESAPLTSPRTCEPGPGTLTITDTENKLSIAGNALVCAGGKATPAWGDPTIGSVAEYSEVAGRTVLFTSALVSTGSDGFSAGWGASGAGPDDGIWFANGSTYISGVNVPITAVSAPSTSKVAIVRRATNGTFYIVNGKLEWVKSANDSANRYITFWNKSAAFSITNLRVLDIPSWSADANIYTSKLTSPAAGATATMTKDALVDVTFVFSGVFSLWYRCLDTSSYQDIWYFYVAADGSYEFGEYNGGVQAVRATGAAGTFTAGTRRIVGVVDGLKHSWYLDNTLLFTYTSVSDAKLNYTGVRLDIASGGVASITSWPRYPAFPNVP